MWNGAVLYTTQAKALCVIHYSREAYCSREQVDHFELENVSIFPLVFTNGYFPLSIFVASALIVFAGV